jgi:hypothetical protein
VSSCVFAVTLGDVRKLTVCYTNKSKKITAWGPLSQKLLKWLYPPQKKANTIAFNISSGRVRTDFSGLCSHTRNMQFCV